MPATAVTTSLATDPDPTPIEPGRRRSGESAPLRLSVVAAVALLVLVGALVGGAVWLDGRVRASLPRLDGEVQAAGLTAPVTVQRDALGVATIRAANRADAAFATGFVHAQDRFFQMDLLRRQAAGELAELFGPQALGWDRRIRVHRFRRQAERVVAESEHRTLLEAYARGVNAGLDDLGERPPEYLALNREPEPWRAEDSALVLLAMFIELNDEDGSGESTLGVLHDVLPPALAEFLAPRGTEWDAPVEGEAFETPPVPGPEVVDLRTAPPPADVQISSRGTGGAGDGWAQAGGDSAAAGSNSWAVAGGLTAAGGAIVANDMHLGLSVPNTWYRAQLRFGTPDGDEIEVTGVTLPGAPIVVVGSNTHVAWGFTNSYGDFTDLVVLEPDPAGEGGYLTPDGPRPYEVHREEIRVRGQEPYVLEVRWTVWGPVVDDDHRGRPRALRWTAHDTEAVGLQSVGLETARTLEAALDVAARSGIPPQNFVCAAADGRIGWTIMGRIPRREGFDGRLPGRWDDGERRWNGFLAAGEVPRIVAPPEGRLWTANARVVGGEKLRALGDGGYALGARAGQIRDHLRSLERPDEAAMLAVQLDDRALFLQRWRDLLLDVLEPEAVAGHPGRRQLRDLAEGWGGRAAVESAGYRMVRAFRLYVTEEVVGALVAPCVAADERFAASELPQTEGPVWRLVSERPRHLLPPGRESWPALLLAAADRVVEQFGGDGGGLADHTWGERNTARITHPLSGGRPFLTELLDMPPDQLPGDAYMPRVQAPAFGASERLAVSPGRERDGYLHMPGGQSGHPLSPFFRAGHRAWVQGEPTPFLPGEPRHTVTLSPGGAAG